MFTKTTVPKHRIAIDLKEMCLGASRITGSGGGDVVCVHIGVETGSEIAASPSQELTRPCELTILSDMRE
jgi:hypothetical protein